MLLHVNEQPFRYRYLDWKSKMYSNHITLNGFTGKKNSPDQMTMQQALQYNPLLLQYQLVSYQTKKKEVQNKNKSRLVTVQFNLHWQIERDSPAGEGYG